MCLLVCCLPFATIETLVLIHIETLRFGIEFRVPAQVQCVVGLLLQLLLNLNVQLLAWRKLQYLDYLQCVALGTRYNQCLF